MKPAITGQNKKLAYLPGAKPGAPKKKRLASVLAVLVVVYFSVLFVTQYLRLVQLSSTLEMIESDIRIVQEQNNAMLREIERLNSPAYLEQMARQELGMVRSGELLFFLQDGDSSSVDNP